MICIITNLYNRTLKPHNLLIGSSLATLFVFFIVIMMSCRPQGKSDPRLYIEDSTWDFGAVIDGDTPSHVFKLKNRGGKTLHIERIEAECACTATAPSTNELLPGATSELKASLDTQDRQGELVKRVEIYSNDPASPVTTITLKAFIYPVFTIAPEYLHFGSNGSRSVVISSHPEIGLQIRELETSASYISAHSSSTTIENGNVLHTLLVNVDAEASAKSLDVTENLIIRTNIKNHNEIKIPIRVHLGQIVTIQPTKLFFGVVPRGEEKLRTTMLSVPTGMDFHIEKVECEYKFLMPTLTQLDSDTYHVHVKLSSNAPVGLFRDTLNVYTTVPSTSLSVEVRGIVRE